MKVLTICKRSPGTAGTYSLHIDGVKCVWDGCSLETDTTALVVASYIQSVGTPVATATVAIIAIP